MIPRPFQSPLFLLACLAAAATSHAQEARGVRTHELGELVRPYVRGPMNVLLQRIERSWSEKLGVSTMSALDAGAIEKLLEAMSNGDSSEGPLSRVVGKNSILLLGRSSEHRQLNAALRTLQATVMPRWKAELVIVETRLAFDHDVSSSWTRAHDCVRRLERGEGGRVIGRWKASGRMGDTLLLGESHERKHLSDFNIEIGDGELVLDPEISPLNLGRVFVIQARPVPFDDSYLLNGAFRSAHLTEAPSTVSLKMKRMAFLESYKMWEQSAVFTLQSPRHGCFAYEIGRSKGGDHRTLVHRARDRV